MAPQKRMMHLGAFVHETGQHVAAWRHPEAHYHSGVRFADMVESGAVEEVRALLARKLNPNLPVMRGIGVREIGAFLIGALSREEAIAAGQQATRRYAKRQYTWFGHQPPPEWPRFRDIPIPVRAELVEALSFPRQ